MSELPHNNETRQLAAACGIGEAHAANIIALLDEGHTVPFIARYRKELTGSIDDQMLRSFADKLTALRNLEKRRQEVLSSIEEQGKLTPELRTAILAATTQVALEDLYLPYKKKRVTRASLARDRGLEPLAQALLGDDASLSIPTLAQTFVDGENGVSDADAAIAGAQDIIAEQLAEDAMLRGRVRAHVLLHALLNSSEKPLKKDVSPEEAAKREASVYRSYFEFSEAVSKIPTHRVLAINRGESEGVLKVSIELEAAPCVELLRRHLQLQKKPHRDYLEPVCQDSFDRLLFPSLERELRGDLTDRATEAAISNFSLNLRNLLIQPPLADQVVLGLDPGFRTGCKLAVVDATSRVLATGVIYPTPPRNELDRAADTLRRLIETHGVTVVAIGNGTASRESEQFVAGVLRDFPGVGYVMVSEAGASVYSASPLAAEEMPDFDVSLRSAVSIARRLQDPLAELVKIEPRSIGVGQYQHDMPPTRLGHALGGVVEGCVNAVGADLNTASPSLLSYIAGVGPGLAHNIVAYREENGAFALRSQLLKVPKLGKKSFEQCAGFLRIRGGKQGLDATAVHPESYDTAKALLALCGLKPDDVTRGNTEALVALVETEGLPALAERLQIGMPTLTDIVAELQRPGRDPRDELPPPVLRQDVLKAEDLIPGMELTGTVRNVVDFGAFVDIGVHDDGLVHVSQLADRFVKHPADVVKVGDIVQVRVLEVDQRRGRISLTMKKNAPKQ